MHLSLQLVNSVKWSDRLELQQNRMGRAYEVADYYGSQPRHTATIKLGREEQHIDYVLASPHFLNHLYKGEKFGAYLGDMMFVNSEIAEKHPTWVPYVLLKLHGEKFIDTGLDTSGRVQHLQALHATLRIAGMGMAEEEFAAFAGATRDADSSNYFKLDTEINDFLKGGELGDAKRAYLESHHDNKWVARGRLDEALAEYDPSSGFRNHAEAIMARVKNFDLQGVYDAAIFVRLMRDVEGGVPFVINPPYTSIAYCFTKGHNDVANLIKFHDMPNRDRNDRSDLVTKIPKKDRTWEAVGKRLSYRIMDIEEGVRRISDAQAKRLDGLVVQLAGANEELASEVAQTRALVASRAATSSDADNRLVHMARQYAARLSAFDLEKARLVDGLAALEQLSRELRMQI